MTGAGEFERRNIHILGNGGSEPLIKDGVTHKVGAEPYARKAAEQPANVLFDTAPEGGIREVKYRATGAHRALMSVSGHL
jgi:hypothetical protein